MSDQEFTVLRRVIASRLVGTRSGFLLDLSDCRGAGLDLAGHTFGMERRESEVDNDFRARVFAYVMTGAYRRDR